MGFFIRGNSDYIGREKSEFEQKFGAKIGVMSFRLRGPDKINCPMQITLTLISVSYGGEIVSWQLRMI